MKNKSILIFFLLLIISVIGNNYILNNNKSLATTNTISNTKNIYQQAIVETAYQYYYREKALQYDNSVLNYEVGNQRRTRGNALTLYNTPNPRTLVKTTFYSPEEATTGDIHYSVCSHFVVNVYGETFKQNNKKYTLRKANGDEGFDTLFLNEAKENYSYQTINNNTELNNCINSTCLEPGDLILRMGTSGNHVMLYVGNGKILHSSGTAPKAYTNVAIKINNYNIPNGTYRFESKADIIETASGTFNVNNDSGGTIIEDCINPNNSKCINVFGTSKSVDIIKIIDNIEKDNSIELSNNAKSRLNATGIVIDKKVTIGTNTNEKSIETIHSVNLNDIINYKINIKNKSNNNYKNIKLIELIPENTTFYAASNECNKNINTITCSFNLNANSQKTFYIRVKVKDNKNILGKTINSISGKVNIGTNYSIPTKNIYTTVNRTLNENDRTKLVDEVYKYKDNNSFTGLANDFVNYIYKKIGYDINLPAQNILFNDMSYINDDLISKMFNENNASYNTYKSFRNSTLIYNFDNLKKLFNLDRIENKNYSNMIVKNAFGGIFTTSTKEKNGEISRNKTFHNETLLIGDVIYIYDSNASNDDLNKKGGYLKGKQNAYLYLGNGNFATMSSNKVIIYDIFDEKNAYDLYFYTPDRSKEIKVDLTNNTLCPNCKKISRGERLLTSLLGQDSFVILRPSYSIKDELTKIEITTLPTKRNYIQNKESLSLQGGKLKLTYGNYGSEIINLDNSLVKILDFDNTKLGKTNVTIEYKNKTTSFEIEIIPKSLSKISFNEMPTKLTYIQNEEMFNTSSGSIKLHYNDGSSEIVNLSSPNIKISGFNNTKLGKNTIKINYLDKYILLDVNIVSKQEKIIDKIEIVKKPNKLTYTLNEKTLDLTGGILKIYYNDKTYENINMTSNNIKILNFDNSKVGKQKIEISYLDYTTSFDITLIKRKVKSISITKIPTKTIYNSNEKIDLSNGIITITYYDNSTEKISMLSPNINAKVEKNQIIIEYLGKTDSYDIIINQINNDEEMNKEPVKNNNQNNSIKKIKSLYGLVSILIIFSILTFIIIKIKNKIKK